MKRKFYSLLVILTMILGFCCPFTVNASQVNVSSLSALQKKIKSATVGTEIILANGTYSANDVTIEIKGKNGYSDNPIIIRAESPGGVIFENATINFKIENSNYIQIKDMTFIDCHKSGSGKSSIFKIDNSNNCTISGNYLYNCGNRPDDPSPDPTSCLIQIMKGSTYNTIESNVFQRSRAISVGITVDNNPKCYFNTIANNCFIDIQNVKTVWGGNNGMECIQLGQHGQFKGVPLRTTVACNYFENVVGDGSEAVSVKTSHNDIIGNTFRNCKSAITLRSGRNNTVDGNYIISKTTSKSKGIRIYERNHIVTNNYIFGGDYGITVGGGYDNKNNQYDYDYGGYGPDGPDSIPAPSEFDGDHYPAEYVKVCNNTCINNKLAGIVLLKEGYASEGYAVQPPQSIKICNNFVMNTSPESGYRGIKNRFTDEDPIGSSSNFRGNCYTGNFSYPLDYINYPSGFVSVSDPGLDFDGDVYRVGANSPLNTGGTPTAFAVIDIDGQARPASPTNPGCGADYYSTEGITNFPLTVYNAGPGNKKWLCGQEDGCYIFGGDDCYIEAEWFQTKGDYINIIGDVSKSGGKYIKIPSAATNNNEAVYTSYTICAHEEGDYYVWAYGTGPNAASDSVKVQVNGGDYVTIPLGSDGWHWRRSESRVNFSEGINEFKVCDREAGAAFDKLFFTTASSNPDSGVTAMTPCRNQFYEFFENENYYIETEWYQSKGESVDVISDSSASAGRYMRISPDASNNNNNAYTSYIIYSEEAGDYYVWSYGTGPDSASDSFRLRANDGAFVTLYQNTGSNFHWRRSEGTVHLNTGINEFRVYDRESGAMSDKLFFSTDGSATPSASGEAEYPVSSLAF